MARSSKILGNPLLAVSVLALVGYLAIATPAEHDNDEVQSGVIADVSVHAVIIDGATGTTASSMSTTFKPASFLSASIAPTTLGLSFAPLEVTSSAGSCGRSLTVDASPIDGYLGRQFIDTPDDRIDVDVNDGETGAAVSGASVEIYLSGTPPKLVASGKTSTYGDYDSPKISTTAGQSYYARASKSGYCPATDTPILTRGTTTPPPSGGAGGADPANAYIPVGVTGQVETKNLAQPVSLTARVTITTPNGKTVSHDLPTASIPAAGGAIQGVAGNFTVPKTDLGVGRTTLAVTLTASSVDTAGNPVSDTATITLHADTGATGEIKIVANPASFTTLSLMPNGELTTRTSTLNPR